MNGRGRLRLGLVLTTCLLGDWLSAARGQTAAEMSQTAAFAAAQQNADGGFAPAPGQPSTLAATNTGLRVLDYAGGTALDVPAAVRFVRSCQVPGGGFSQTPGGKADVVPTALGLLAAAELHIADKAMIDAAVVYFGANAKSFEDVRMAIAGLEGVGATSPDFARWARQIEELRQADGSFGSGASRAFISGGAGAAILRMRMPLEKRESVIDAIKAGQRPDGAWSKDDGPSDLSSSYRVMRALYMLETKPDAKKLVGFIASCRKPDGSYSMTPGGPGSLGSTYYAAIMTHWLRLLDGGVRVLEPVGFTSLFNGESLAEWEGESTLWSVRDGMLVGKSPGMNHNEFLATRKSYGNFIFSVRFRLENGQGNSGIQFRSVRIPGTEMSGYQADIGEKYWGCLYDESRRNKVLVTAAPEALKILKPDDWNHYVIHAMDNQITLYLNGVASAIHQEDVTSMAREGLIAVQIHGGGPMEVQFKEIKLRPLP